LPILAEGGGEVVRADEDAVDAVDLGDRLDLVERAFGLDLHQQADLAAWSPGACECGRSLVGRIEASAAMTPHGGLIRRPLVAPDILAETSR